ncbi:MAG: hypothetical protein R3F56_09115 [Planctomycetota bacterium]
MSHRSLPVLSLLLAAASLPAQTYNTAPDGFATVEGNSNNTIPFWAQSGTYQQVHDAADLTNVFGPVAVINSINLRKDGLVSSTVAGRAADFEFTLGVTTVSAITATGVFATNLGSAPQVVLPYTNINLPALANASVPNPIGWTFPFTVPFTYTPSSGNLCWEMRFTNATVNTNAAMDAVSRLNAETLSNVGAGCIATGQTSAAAIGLRSLSMTTGAWRNRLDRAAVSAPAVQLVGVGQTTIPLPGFCSNLEALPLVTVAGGTDATGQWDNTITFGSLLGVATLDIVAQFAWIDGGLANGLGLSDASLIRLPANSIRNVSRIYNAPSNGGLGNETALTGSLGVRYGFVTTFGQ